MRSGALDASFLRSINEEGYEFDVTLFVSGWWITGWITPAKLFNDWRAEVGARSSKSEEGFRVPGTEVPDPTPGQLAAAKRHWAESPPDGSQQDENASVQFVVRNAKCWHPGYTSPIPHPYLCIDSAAVDAWTPGILQISLMRHRFSHR